LIKEKISRGEKVEDWQKDDDGNTIKREFVTFNELRKEKLKEELSDIGAEATKQAKKETIEKYNLKISQAQ
jgi:hypothetical protein